tara:strand:+ start:1718 stop:2755 length:1038 start_codon:yes stop_codon:yes gene_type:complete
MPYTSPFFSTVTGYSGEQSMVDDLVREQIKIYGMDVLYMPRRNVNLDKLLHESSKSAFEFGMPIPMYLKTFSGYQNGMELLSKFGVRSSDEITMVMSRSEFITYYSPFIKSYHNAIKGAPSTDELNRLEGETAARPKEGDLIYFPFDDGIFEIKYVMFDQPFFQLGQGYVFEIQCEKFEYSGETFDTGINTVDDAMVKPDYFRLEFDLTEGTDSFQEYETIKIYDVSLPVSGDDTLDFRLYKDAGFLQNVPYSTGKVMEWNSVTKKLLVSDLSDYDPDQIDRTTGDVTKNKFDNVMIVGDKSAATWYSSKAEGHDMAFNDSKTIQDEFHQIKILDPGDENPFGFI